MNFLKIAWRDIVSIFKNRFIRISVFAIVIVPLLYSLLYLYAFWDPYAKLTSLPVAIVNEDTGGLNDNKKVNYGEDIVKKLKDNNLVGWQFVGVDEAQKGTTGSKYYAEFVIPKDFSEKILSGRNTTPKQPEILYVANEKRNFLAAQIDNKIESELKAEIIKSITSEYTKVTFDNLFDIKDALKKAADGSAELKDGLVTATNGSKDLKNGMGTLNSSVPALSDGVRQLYSGSQTLSTKLNDAKIGAVSLNDGTSKLFTGVNKLNSGANSVDIGANKLNSGITSLDTGANKLNSGITNLDTGANKLNLGITSLDTGANKLNSGINSANDGAEQLSNGLNGVYKDGSPVVVDGVPQVGLKNGVQQIATGINNAKAGVSQVAGGINGVYKDGSPVVVDGVPQVGLKNGTAQVATGIDTLVSKVTSSGQNLEDGLNQAIQTYIASNPSIASDVNFQKFLGDLNTTKSNSALSSTDISNMNYLKTSAHSIANGAAQLSGGVNQLSTGMNALSTGIDTVNAGTKKLADGSIALVTGTKQLSVGSSQLVDGTKQLSVGSSQLADGTKQLSVGSSQLITGTKQLSDGSSQLVDGTKQLSDGSSQLVTGTKQLSDGSSQLADGTKKLYDGSTELKNGLGTLNNKVPELASGTKKLFTGTIDLNIGLNKLTDGGIELSDKLKEGSDKVTKNLVNSSQTMADYVSEPITVNQQPFEAVANYGTGFASYFIPLSLWVGAMLMFFVITDKVDIEGEVSSTSLVLGKFLSYAYIGFLQAVLTAIAVLFLGLKPNNMLLYFTFTIFMSFVFIAIIQCFVFLFGQVGRLLSIILLILQLTACAGTFPLELVPNLFKILNPFMPFTYCSSSLREIISGHDTSFVLGNIGILSIVMVCFLLLSIVFKNHTDKIKEKIQNKKNMDLN